MGLKAADCGTTSAAYFISRLCFLDIMRVIIFSGGDEFEGGLEIQGIAEKHSIYPVPARLITSHNVYDILASHPCDVVHWGLHSGPDGIELPDGTIFSADDIARSARTAGARIVVLNSCESARLATIVAFKGIEFVFYGTSKPTNEEALQFATCFYCALPESLENPLQVLESYTEYAYDGDGDFSYVLCPRFVAKLLRRNWPISIRNWQWIAIALMGILSMVLSVMAMHK